MKRNVNTRPPALLDSNQMEIPSIGFYLWNGERVSEEEFNTAKALAKELDDLQRGTASPTEMVRAIYGDLSIPNSEDEEDLEEFESETSGLGWDST